MRGGEELLVYDPVTMTKMGSGRVTTAGFGARLLSPTSDESSPLAKAANALYDVTRDGSWRSAHGACAVACLSPRLVACRTTLGVCTQWVTPWPTPLLHVCHAWALTDQSVRPLLRPHCYVSSRPEV